MVLSPAGHSVDPGSAGLLGRRGPRSKQPFMVTFFRASPSPSRVTRAAKPPRRRQPKKSNDLPHPNKLPGIFGKVFSGGGGIPYGKHEAMLVSAMKSPFLAQGQQSKEVLRF